MRYTWNWRECIRRSERESPRSRFARRFAQRLALSDALARSTCTEPLSHGKIAVGFVSSKGHDSIYNASSITAPFRSPKSERISLFKVKEFVRIFIGIRVWSERAEGTSRPAISLPLPSPFPFRSLFSVHRVEKTVREEQPFISFLFSSSSHPSINDGTSRSTPSLYVYYSFLFVFLFTFRANFSAREYRVRVWSLQSISPK